MGKAKRAHHLLAERTLNVAKIATPVWREQSAFNKAMEAAVRPIGRVPDVVVLHRVVVNIVDMSFKVVIVANCVLPVSSLPDAFFSLGDLAP